MLLVLAALPLDGATVPAAEADVFAFVNERTLLPFVVVWMIMQFGNVLVVPAAALLAALLERFRLAAGLLLAGLAAYVVARVVKRLVDRARPAELLTGVDLRGAAPHGLGFVSGHAAVATALAAFAWPWLGRRARVAVAVVAGLVCLARVYVGAHLPLDVVGGLGVGLGAAGVARLVVGRPVRRP